MKKIALIHPVKWGEEEVKELELQRPKGKHFKRFPIEPSMGDFLKLGVELAGMSPSFADEVDGEDVMKVVEAVGNFIGGSTPTGSIA